MAWEWLEELMDEIAVAEEMGEEDAAPVVWARALRRDLGSEGAVAAVLESPSIPPAVRRIALEELAR